MHGSICDVNIYMYTDLNNNINIVVCVVKYYYCRVYFHFMSHDEIPYIHEYEYIFIGFSARIKIMIAIAAEYCCKYHCL